MTEKTTLLTPEATVGTPVEPWPVAMPDDVAELLYDDGTGQPLPPGDAGSTTLNSGSQMEDPDSTTPDASHRTTDVAPRCEAVNIMTGQPCNRLLGVLVTRPWIIDCDRHHRNERE